MSKHLSVLVEEVIENLQPKSGGTYLDATFGGGGHSRIILERSEPNGRVVGIDRDPAVKVWADELAASFSGRIEFHNISFDKAGELSQKFDGILADLGMSSDQLEDEARGFSFSKDSPLDLRFDDRSGQTAAQFLQQASQSKIAEVFYNFAQDRHAGYLAAKIVAARKIRPIKSTQDFVSIVGTNQPKVLAPLFQALRIQVNDELNVLKRGLKAMANSLKPGGRLAIISFHSLEDAIVKEFFRSSVELKIITKKPITSSNEEIIKNPRSRSAKLRVGERLEEGTDDRQ
jgi:16S rRNA (cytosine1402-N4)-methyltransferase